MTTYVNARFLTQDVTGVQRFAREISKSLSEQRDDLVFLVPRGTVVEGMNTSARVREIGRSSGHVWEQWDLPRFLRSERSPLLLNLMGTAPAFYRNQIGTVHDITYVRFPDSFSRSFRTAYGVIVPRVLRNSRAIITVSAFSREEIAGRFDIDPQKIHVINNAVDTQFRPGELSENEARYLLAVSSPSLHKNFARMIDAFQRLDPTASVQLKIIGGQNKIFHQQEVAADPRISFLGRVSDSELVSLYQHATAFIFPSLYEGFGIPPLEAQACGCPVISSNAASMPEVLRDSVCYIDPYDVDAMASAIDHVLGDESERLRLTAAGFSNVARYSWSESAADVSRLIDAVSFGNAR